MVGGGGVVRTAAAPAAPTGAGAGGRVVAVDGAAGLTCTVEGGRATVVTGAGAGAGGGGVVVPGGAVAGASVVVVLGGDVVVGAVVVVGFGARVVVVVEAGATVTFGAALTGRSGPALSSVSSVTPDAADAQVTTAQVRTSVATAPRTLVRLSDHTASAMPNAYSP